MILMINSKTMVNDHAFNLKNKLKLNTLCLTHTYSM